jgi:hypothetical protein
VRHSVGLIKRARDRAEEKEWDRRGRRLRL